MLFVDPTARYAPDCICKRACDVFGQSQCLADITNGAARTITDNSRYNGRTISGITFINILHDLFAPLMLEVDVDIRRFLALGRNETLKQKIHFSRVHAGNA